MKIIFLVDAFPVISETFIINQITGLIDLGHDVLIFAAERSTDTQCHSDVRKYDLLSKTYYHNDAPVKKGWRSLQALFMLIAFAGRNWQATLNSLNVFKYGRDALALTYFYKVMLFLGVREADIIQCHYGPNGTLGARLKEMGLRGKIVTMFHGYDIRRGISCGGEMYRLLFKEGDLFLSISQYNHRHLVAFGADPKKIRPHPVGIDLVRYSGPAARAPYEGGRPVKIVTVSRLVPEKGLADGLNAIRGLVERGHSVEYHIIGSGPLEAQLRALAKSLEIERSVHFWGSQDQDSVIAMLKEADLFFLPSVAEALPVVLMEAQAMRLPVVATNVGSVFEVMRDDESGFLVASGDHHHMCERLDFLIRHPQQWPAMGEKGRSHVEEHFDIRKLNERLVGLYQSLLEQHRV